MIHDPEVPAGFQEADILQSQYEVESAAYRADIAKGICHHSWILGRAPDPKFNATREEILRDRQRGEFPDRPTDESIKVQTDIPQGLFLCLDCGILIDEDGDPA